MDNFCVCDAVSHLVLDGVPDEELLERAIAEPTLAMLHQNGVWRPLREASAAYAKLMGEYVARVYVVGGF